MLKQLLSEFVKDEAGQSIVEYTLLLTLIGAVSVFVLTLLGINISRMFGVNINVEDAYEKFQTK